jgi:mono/diheme cytochrome c family protein
MESGRQRHSDAAIVAIAVAAIALVVVGGVLTGYVIGHNNGHTATPTSMPASTGSTSTGSSGTGGTTGTTNVSDKVAFGAHAFVQFACAQCHGEQGAGGVSPDVPALQQIAKGLTVAQLTDIIEHGAGVSTNPTKPFMPIWHGIVSKHQISALVAYMKAGFPAVDGATALTVPTGQGGAVAGLILYQRYGCINCHGPNGLGGVPNPQSPDKSVPPLSGADFRAQFNTPQKIADVIRSGSVIGKAPIVSMPHWGTILSDQQISELIAYIDNLS